MLSNEKHQTVVENLTKKQKVLNFGLICKWKTWHNTESTKCIIKFNTDDKQCSS